jgi:hypothetical protein
VPRDASTAAIVASALIELSTLTWHRKQILFDICSGKPYKHYQEPPILLNIQAMAVSYCSIVSSLPHHSKSMFMTYADYYYLEGLTRLERSKIKIQGIFNISLCIFINSIESGLFLPDHDLVTYSTPSVFALWKRNLQRLIYTKLFIDS